EEVVERGYDADADRVVVLRDVPPPALLVRSLDDESGAFVAACVAIGALPVRPDRPLVEHRIPEAKLEAVLEHRALAARVDDHRGVNLFLAAVLALDADAGRAVAVKEHLQHASRLVDLDSLLDRKSVV